MIPHHANAVAQAKSLMKYMTTQEAAGLGLDYDEYYALAQEIVRLETQPFAPRCAGTARSVVAPAGCRPERPDRTAHGRARLRVDAALL